ncbi:hypothetical protein JCM10049v2_000967 [Rhodotorula toruloides]
MGADKERFTTTLPNHLHCRACVEISYPAVIVCSQGHHLCRPCAEKIEESGELECPLCLRPMKLPLRESLLLRRAVEDYEFTCRHEGCDWIGSVVDEDEHADKCEFGPVACSFGNASKVAKHGQHAPTSLNMKQPARHRQLASSNWKRHSKRMSSRSQH